MRKKHPKKRSHPGPLLSTDGQDLLNSLLEDLSAIEPSTVGDRLQSPQVAVVFLERIPPENPSTPALVLAIQDAFPGKEVQKAVRKTIFRLKQRGIDIAQKESAGSPGLFGVQPEQPPEPGAYLSPPDGIGNRAVFISIPRFPAGVDLGMGIVSDEKGVLEFVFGRYSKKRAKEMRDVFFQNVTNPVESSLAHAAAVLESAYDKGKSGPNPSAGDYLELRPWLLGNVSMPDKPLILDLISPESVSELALTDSQVDKLLGHNWLQTWITDPDEIGPLIEEIKKVEQSPILVSPEQKAGRIMDLKESFLSRIYPVERRRQLKARLEEVAYLLHNSGEEDFARVAFKAALSMEEKDSGFRTNDFLRHMFEHSLALYLRSVEKGGKKGIEEKSPPALILP
jgi:hypothetical protein